MRWQVSRNLSLLKAKNEDAGPNKNNGSRNETDKGDEK